MAVSPFELVERCRREYFDDTRQCFADLRIEQRLDSVCVHGSILDRPAAELLLSVLRSHAPATDWRDELHPLVMGPDYGWALANRPVLEVRNEPRMHAEQVTQILFGEPVEVLRRVGSWAFVRGQDGYLGWTPQAPLHACGEGDARAWVANATHLVRQPLLPVYADPSGEAHQQIMLLPFGARLHIEDIDGLYGRVRCPNGATRWAPMIGLLPVDELRHSGIAGLRKVVDWAHTLLGVPYLWGGKTPFGYDCSGLVQILYAMIGLPLRRDADQQFVAGQSVDGDDLQFGDCLFFDTKVSEAELHQQRHELRVTHVALALDRHTFLMSSWEHGGVVRGSFDPASPWYIAAYQDRLLGVRRYI